MKVTMSAPRLKSWLLLASLLVTISAARLVQAQASVGNIEVCYHCDNEIVHADGLSGLDGPIFLIFNTSSSPITNGILKIGPGGGFTDSFSVGTIPAATEVRPGVVVVVPGISNDNGTGHTFFKFTCSLPSSECIRDTSDAGPQGNDTQFEFTGRQGSSVIDSFVFTPAATQLSEGPNFLGGPDNNDFSCSVSTGQCFDSIVASLFPSPISSSLILTLSTGVTNFNNYPGIISTFSHVVDYSNSHTSFSDIRMMSTFLTISDFGWKNQWDQLTLGTTFQGKKCVHSELKAGTFACVVIIDVCSKSGGPFAGKNCPEAATAADFIELTQTFNTDAEPILFPVYIEGADKALTCAPRFLSPNPADCRNLRDILVSFTDPAGTGRTNSFKSLFAFGKQ